MEVTEERRTFDKVIVKLKWIGGCLKSALYFGGIRFDGLSVEESACKIKATVEELNHIEVSDFIGSWLKMPENSSLLEVWINEILNTYFYHKEVENSNFKPQQLGDDWVMIAKNYDTWRNTIIYKLSLCLPDGAAMIYEGKRYVMFPKTDEAKDKSKTKAKQRTRGKQKRSFRDCLFMDDKENLLKILHKLIDGNKGKFVANVISFCVSKGILIKKPTYTQVVEEFGDIGDKSGYNKYMGIRLDWKEEEPIKKTLEGYF